MTRMTMIQSIRSAMDNAMGRDDDVVVFGQDVGFFGGVFRCTEGLQEKYGANRCFDTPINESGIIGAAIGMAAYGLRPCVEIQFADYMYPGYDQIARTFQYGFYRLRANVLYETVCSNDGEFVADQTEQRSRTVQHSC